MMTTSSGKAFPISDETPKMIKAREEAHESRKTGQKAGGVSEHLCRVEDKLDRILTILNGRQPKTINHPTLNR